MALFVMAAVACAGHDGAPVSAQEPTATVLSPQADGARSIAAAFRALADVAAGAGDDTGWQQADAAYNNVVLAAIDLHRPALLQAGDAARGPLEVIDAALFQVGQALDAQDAARIRAQAERVAEALDVLAPGLAGSAPALGAALASWRDLALDYERLAERQRGGEDVWRDMRNAAILLIDDLETRAPAVQAAVPGGALAIDQVRVLAYRMRMAALDQSGDAAGSALALFDRALRDLERAASTAGVPARAAPAELYFEGRPVVAQIGQSVAVPIVTHGVAEVGGLGGFVLDIRWSPRALRVDDVRWKLGGAASATANDVAAGHYVLELPPAPVGPEVDAQVVELIMTVLGVTPDPADYVPSETLDLLNDALDDAAQRTRSGDVAVASARLFGAYVVLAEGRGTYGSLYSRLEAVGQAASVEAPWLRLLDRASRPEPAGADAIVEAIDAARAALAAGVAAYVASLAGDGGIPVTIDVISATDLAGRPLDTRASIPARVLTTGLVTPTAISSTVGGGSPLPITATIGVGAPGGMPGEAATSDPSLGTASDTVVSGAPRPSELPNSADAESTGRSAMRLVALLAAAVAMGGVGALLSARRGARPQ